MILPKIDSILYDFTIPSTKTTIKLRQLRAKDEKILLTAKESTGSPEERNIEILNGIKQVINNAIVTPGIKVEELALFDIEAAFIKLRALSVSNIIQATYQDNEEMAEYYEAVENWKNQPELVQKAASRNDLPKEPASYSFDIDLNKVEVVWPEGISPLITIPNNNITVRMKYPDASLYTNAEFLAASGEKLVELLIQNSLESIEANGVVSRPKDLPVAEVKEFLDELPIAVYDKIREFLEKLPHLHYVIEYKNKKGSERKIVLDKLSDFFSF
jgi:hypothetical protein